MKLNIWKVVWKSITGFGSGSAADYLFGLVNQALSGLGGATKEKIVATLNFTMKVLSAAEVVRILIPAKWQIAYNITVNALKRVVVSLQDLNLTGEELQSAIEGYQKAYEAWKGPDDDTCADPVKLEFNGR